MLSEFFFFFINLGFSDVLCSVFLVAPPVVRFTQLPGREVVFLCFYRASLFYYYIIFILDLCLGP